MLKGFEGYYPPDFKKLWREATIVPDANILLDLYRYSPQSRDEFLGILDQLDGRLWIPHQFFFEYHRKRLNVRRDVSHQYDSWMSDLRKSLGTARANTVKVLQEVSKRTRFHMELQEDWLEQEYNALVEQLETCKQEHESSLADSSLESRIAQLFEGKYGKPFDAERLAEVKELARNRRKSDIPPGSKKDDRKERSDPDGDFIGWQQIKEFARETGKSIIMVSNDNDWFMRHKGETKGPHHVLRQEMYDDASVSCYFYNWARFISSAKDHLDAPVSDEAIAEAEDREKYSPVEESLFPSSGDDALESAPKYVRRLSSPFLETQSLQTDALRSLLEQQRIYDSIFKPTLNEQLRWLKESTLDLLRTANKPFIDTHRQQDDTILAEYQEAMKRMNENFTKNLRR